MKGWNGIAGRREANAPERLGWYHLLESVVMSGILLVIINIVKPKNGRESDCPVQRKNSQLPNADDVEPKLEMMDLIVNVHFACGNDFIQHKWWYITDVAMIDRLTSICSTASSALYWCVDSRISHPPHLQIQNEPCTIFVFILNKILLNRSTMRHLFRSANYLVLRDYRQRFLYSRFSVLCRRRCQKRIQRRRVLV